MIDTIKCLNCGAELELLDEGACPCFHNTYDHLHMIAHCLDCIRTFEVVHEYKFGTYEIRQLIR